ncbi:MAG: GatB/YqeY domain-containing protein [Terriglobales bacterium]
MGLSERIQQDAVVAMKSRAELRLSTLRMMKAAIKNREIELRHPLDEPGIHLALAAMIKQRQDAATQFAAGGRPELADKERSEIVIIESYLPAALGAEQVEAAVRAAMASTGAASIKDMGKVMKAAMAQFQAAEQRVDGKLVSDTVKRLLTPPAASA